MNCAIYARVSTTDQNCEMQLRELREYAARRGWEVYAEYVDTGFSGTKKSRPALDRMMKDASLHKFDAVLVWKIDRFGRSVANLAEGVNNLASWEVRFVAVTQNIDTDESNPMTRLLLHILSAIAEFEREMIRERVKAGMNAARHRGKQLGRRKKVFDRLRAQELRDTGKSIRQIAAELGVGKSLVADLFQLSGNGSGGALAKPLN